MNQPIIVSRQIALSKKISDSDIHDFILLLTELPSVSEAICNVEKRHIVVEYDQLKLTFSDITELILKSDLKIEKGLKPSILRFWYDYLARTFHELPRWLRRTLFAQEIFRRSVGPMDPAD